MKLTELLRSLDSLVRTGWMLRGVNASIGETVSQHSFKTALITLILIHRIGGEVDAGKSLAMALIHDLAEGLTGDIVPLHGFRDRKEKVESRIVVEKFSLKPIIDLYSEYVKGESLEAKIVKLADYLATYLKALEYRELGYRVDDLVENISIKIKKYSVELGVPNPYELVAEI